MPSRRAFIKTTTNTLVGALATTWPEVEAANQSTQAIAVKRREAVLEGARIRVIDIHGHMAVPEVVEVVRRTPLHENAPQSHGPLVLGPERLRILDERGIDVQVLTQQGSWWYATPDRQLANDIVSIQNERTSLWCTAHADRFVGFASVALQFPEMAAQQLEYAVKKLGMRGAAISAGSVQGKDLSSPEFDVFWAKAEELQLLVFMHPAGETIGGTRLQGKGNLANTVGNPLDTTLFLSHLIFEGTLDRFPKLKICAAHAGGYLPSYLGRSQLACAQRPEACLTMSKPFDAYFKDQIMIDSMIFREEGLRHLVAEVGISQIVFGTDIPFMWPSSIDFILSASFLTSTEKAAILGGNLAAVLRIPS